MTQTPPNMDFELPPLIDKPPAVIKAKAPFNQYRNEKRVCITLERNKEIPPTGQFIGYTAEVELEDGTMHRVSREFILVPGKKAWVPEGLCNVLNDAIQSVPVLGGDGTLVVGYEDQLRFPYRVHTNEPVPPEYTEGQAIAEAA